MSEAVDNSPIHPPAVALKATEQQSASTASTRHVAPDRGQRPSDWLYVHAMDLNAQGVGHREDGKVVFIDGALPGEWVTAQVHHKKKQLGNGLFKCRARAIIAARGTTQMPTFWFARWQLWRLQNAALATNDASGHQTACFRRQPVALGQGKA